MFRPVLIKAACVAAVLSSCLAASAMAEPNPEYASWSKCKPGATVTIKGNTEAMGQKSTQTIVHKLVDMTPEKAVVETTITIEAMGQKMPQPPQKRDVPAEMQAKDPAAAAKLKAYVKANTAKDAKKGEETLSVGGHDVKCTTTEADTEQSGMKAHTKTWTSPDMPGGMVKIETATSGAMASKTTMEVTEFSDGN